MAIGSVPYDEPGLPLDLMAKCLDIPTSPQMVRISPWEDMILGAVSGLPALEVNENRVVTVIGPGREEALTEFYEKFYAGDLDYFALEERAALGFKAFLEKAKADQSFGPSFLKSQVVGPLTFGQSVKVDGQKSLIDSPELLEAISLGIGAKAAWLGKKIRQLGRSAIVFIDEPGLTGYGSAFSTLTPQMVVDSLGSAVKAAKDHGEVLIGCHVCGNTDWGLLSGVGLDILNFDAYEFLPTVCLYPREIRAFLEEGGALAFGIVPTNDFSDQIKAEHLAKMVKDGWQVLANKGLKTELLVERTFLTSACGLGTLAPEKATAILEILPRIAQILKS
jgi:hypothetical protein